MLLGQSLALSAKDVLNCQQNENDRVLTDSEAITSYVVGFRPWNMGHAEYDPSPITSILLMNPPELESPSL